MALHVKAEAPQISCVDIRNLFVCRPCTLLISRLVCTVALVTATTIHTCFSCCGCPESDQDGVLANVTLVCFAPIAFLALWGGGVFGGGLELSMGQRLLYIAGVAMLACLAFLEYDNSTPWHELQRPLLLKGLRIGPTLLENTARLVVYSAIKGLRQWEQQLAILLLLAPLTYPILVQGFHRFQVC